MSSKVLTGSAAAPARPMEWRKAPLGPILSSQANLYSAAAPPNGPADELPEAMRREMEGQIQAAYRRGYQEGENAASQAAASKVDAAVQRLARAIEDLAGHRGRLRRQAETDLVKLAIAISRRILRRELSVDAEVLVGVAKAALDKLGGRDMCRLRVNPAHVALLTRYFEGSGVKVEVLGDGALEPGAAIFETSSGSLDASLETQLSEIERGLTDLCRK